MNVILKSGDGHVDATGVMERDTIETQAILFRHNKYYIYERLYGGNNVEFREVPHPHIVTEF